MCPNKKSTIIHLRVKLNINNYFVYAAIYGIFYDEQQKILIL